MPVSHALPSNQSELRVSSSAANVSVDMNGIPFKEESDTSVFKNLGSFCPTKKRDSEGNLLNLAKVKRWRPHDHASTPSITIKDVAESTPALLSLSTSSKESIAHDINEPNRFLNYFPMVIPSNYPMPSLNPHYFNPLIDPMPSNPYFMSESFNPIMNSYAFDRSGLPNYLLNDITSMPSFFQLPPYIPYPSMDIQSRISRSNEYPYKDMEFKVETKSHL
jgi:hypothetical protein